MEQRIWVISMGFEVKLCRVKIPLVVILEEHTRVDHLSGTKDSQSSLNSRAIWPDIQWTGF